MSIRSHVAMIGGKLNKIIIFHYQILSMYEYWDKLNWGKSGPRCVRVLVDHITFNGIFILARGRRPRCLKRAKNLFICFKTLKTSQWTATKNTRKYSSKPQVYIGLDAWTMGWLTGFCCGVGHCRTKCPAVPCCPIYVNPYHCTYMSKPSRILIYSNTRNY